METKQDSRAGGCDRLAIIVAGGSGTRMGLALPKQFAEVAGRPILMHTIDRFAAARSTRVVVVLPEAHIALWEELCSKHAFATPHTIVKGGATRYASVANGLAARQDERLIAVHDGVRPLVSQETIERCFDEALRYGSAIPVMPSTESVRLLDPDGGSHAIDRRQVMMVQTPQVFRAEVITAAYAHPYMETFTDDASVVETYCGKVHLCSGNSENIKLTWPADLALAEALLADPAHSSPTR